jgi:phosphotransferase system HPr-like phosphotransfer protein
MVEPKSLTQIISEDDFLDLMEPPCKQFFSVFFLFKRRNEEKKEITRKFYSNLTQESEYLENFMDQYGARENKKWGFFVECLASIRNLSIAAFFTRHILDRYPYYNLRESSTKENEFKNSSNNVLIFLDQSILNLLQELYEETGVNGLNISIDTNALIEFSDIESNKRLPRNILEDDVKDEEERVIEVCEKIKHISRLMNDSKLTQLESINELKLAVLKTYNEKRARMHKNLIHNIQSDFDTYVKNTKLEVKHQELKVLRGYVSMPLHLLEVSLWMAHFYERHEDEIRPSVNRKRISIIVNKDVLLDKIINFGFFYSQHFINEGNILADEILNFFSKVVKVELPIPKPLGFHARPCTLVSIIARQYEDMDLFIVIDDKKFSAKSVMSLLQLGGLVADKGYQMVLFEGKKRVIDDIKLLAKHNYCEEEEIPSRLSYLREYQNPR